MLRAHAASTGIGRVRQSGAQPAARGVETRGLRAAARGAVAGAATPAHAPFAAAPPARAAAAAAARRAPPPPRAAPAGGAAPAPRSYDYDIITIGAGSGGVRGSRFAASYGARVAVVELPFEYISSDTAGGVGGTCVLRGCVPKKLMVYASEYASAFRDSEGFGWEGRPLPGHSWTSFLEAKRKELQRLNGAYKNTLKNANVELIEGRGRVVDAHTVDVDGVRYTAKNIVIAVGGKPSRISIPGADLCITSDEALELAERPNKITVLGAGYIALEFAGVFHRFGAETHVAFRAPLPLRGFDEEVRKFATEQYAATGLNLHAGLKPAEVTRQPDGRFAVTLVGEDGSRTVIKDNDQVLMATGRAPKTSGLGLESAGVKLGKKGEVVVDDYSRTNVPSIWAVGDVTDRINLTPVALMEGMALARTIVKGEPTKPDYDFVASAVFSWPNIATVGLTEEQAVKRYGDVDVYTSSFRPMRNTISGSPLRSFMKLIVDAGSGVVVGAHMVGDDSAEIMQGFAVALKLGVTKQQLDATVGIHPTAAEEFVTMRSVSREVRRPAAVAAA
ncbi:glutathione chloroplastic [Raphidocelis subcapitata]|uniref:Glutathione chloroplastic n=1 Tax=Raphidocelis subcapitata TaxID=307507 RepID=A0A2V0PN32_9CHLO|nr:glutathione chloroplastic [Raphidocelis subcapitata]|eukprot:GBF98807.1 glutathione chloroplastic [Raphidocelis subcapitata]